jgi:hypothetical protein
MRLSPILNLGLIAVGAMASAKTLRQRHRWEQSNQKTYIVLDYDDALAVCTRAGMPLPEFLREARQHGATHLSLPELTLHRLLRAGRIAPTIPAHPLIDPPTLGPWVYLTSAEPDLIRYLAAELLARVPSSKAQVLPTSELKPVTATLAVAGDLPTLAEIGLGFETRVAAEALLSGLGLVPRPVSFAWPEDRLIERTMIQVAGLGAKIVAFDGDIILGHEMHLDTTVNCLERLGLHFAYFCETRHQKGDWFIAKRLASKNQVVLSHYFTPAAMVPENFHSAAHHWGMLAHARGIRLCYINVFRRIHATDPLECLQYLEHVRQNLDAFDGKTTPEALPAPDRKSLALTGLASAGAVSMAATRTLRIPEPMALALTAASAAGAATLPYLDRPRGPLEESYPPSYAPKLLALAGASAAPLAASAFEDSSAVSMTNSAFVLAGMAAALAALTTGQDYQQRIEEYRSLNADLFLPLAGVVIRDLDDPKWKTLALAALGVGWYTSRKFSPDILGTLDKDLPAGHTHHLSAAQRFIGDALIALGPQPGRKWAGLGLAGLAVARLRGGRSSRDPARPGSSGERGMGQTRAYMTAASLVSVIGSAFMLAAFRKPERPLSETLPTVSKSWLAGAGAGILIAFLAKSLGHNQVDF